MSSILSRLPRADTNTGWVSHPPYAPRPEGFSEGAPGCRLAAMHKRSIACSLVALGLVSCGDDGSGGSTGETDTVGTTGGTATMGTTDPTTGSPTSTGATDTATSTTGTTDATTSNTGTTDGTGTSSTGGTTDTGTTGGMQMPPVPENDYCRRLRTRP